MFLNTITLEESCRGICMRFGFLRIFVIAMGLLVIPSLALNVVAAESETCADGKPCPTDSELEDSCSDEEESI